MDTTCTGSDTSNAVNNSLDRVKVMENLSNRLRDLQKSYDKTIDLRELNRIGFAQSILGDIIDSIESGEFDLSTEALVSALVMRADVEAGLEVAADCEGIGTVYANPNDGIRIRVAVGAHRFRPLWNAIRSGDLVPMEASK